MEYKYTDGDTGFSRSLDHTTSTTAHTNDRKHIVHRSSHESLNNNRLSLTGMNNYT